MLEAFLKGLTLGLLLIISVGPVVFAIFKQSINNGHIGGFSFVSGVWLSDVLWIILSNLFSSLIADLLRFEKEIGFIGSLFLLALGVYYLFFKKAHLKEDEEKIVITARTHTKLVVSGFLINTLNPGVIAFWFSTATAFAAQSIGNKAIIFGTCLLVNIGVDILKVMLAGKIRKNINDRVLTLINKISGIILLGFGIALMVGVFYVTKKH